MKEYPSADIRNLALVGHAGAGKTMLAEAILAAGGVINRLGSIENGSTVSDFQAAEHERQVSIGASLGILTINLDNVHIVSDISAKCVTQQM